MIQGEPPYCNEDPLMSRLGGITSIFQPMNRKVNDNCGDIEQNNKFPSFTKPPPRNMSRSYSIIYHLIFKMKSASAAVYKAKDRETGWTVAVKKIYLSQQLYKEDVITELLVLREIKHPNVISYLDSYLIGDELWVIMEYLGIGSLDNVLTKTRLSEHDISAICQSFLWPTICYIVQITTSLAALKGMSIPLYTSIKRCGPLVNMILSIMLLKKKTPSWLSQVSVILATIGCMISGTGELTVNYQGYVNVVVCLVSKSCYFTLVEAQNYRVLKFVQLLCYNSLPILLFMSWFTDELGQAFSFLHFSDPQVLTLFVLTVVIGACLVYVEFLCITLTSALTVSILGTIRSICQIILGFFLVGGASTNTLFIVGISLNFFGGLLYLTDKLLAKVKYRYKYICFRNFFISCDL
ncbi:uncharacterized protein LOC143231338 [Tachypleus tridentatus]|uniref:uncharacterized protein LOC143231338 n=1 Tax=Tachypleus tridentatus TaxID=6853 RepID=UPI003FD38DC5